MNAEVFAEWLSRQGHKVYKTSSSYWYDAGPHVLQAFPYHWLITPDKNEIKNLIKENQIIALRYSAPITYNEGKISYHIICNEKFDIRMLNSKIRNAINCGLKQYKIEQISFIQLADEGWELQQSTLKRQNRSRSMNKIGWEKLCFAANDLKGFEVFAAISEGKLAGALIICQIDGIYNVLYSLSHSRFLKSHVNNALFYSTSCNLLERTETKGIFFTVQSLDAPADVDRFKLRMGFSPIPVRQNVVFNPYIKPFINPVVLSINRQLIRWFPGNTRLAKTEGMIKFNLEGRLSADEQTWPDFINSNQYGEA